MLVAQPQPTRPTDVQTAATEPSLTTKNGGRGTAGGK